MSGEASGETSTRKRFDDIEPLPPTSGPIIGAVVRRFGISEPALNSKNAQRYFAGKSGSGLKSSSFTEVMLGVARVLVDVGLFPGARDFGNAALERVSDAVLFNVREWDKFVASMRNKTGLIDRTNSAAVWATYIRLVTIDVAVRIGAGMRVTDTPPDDLELLSYLDRSARGDLLNWIRRDVKDKQGAQDHPPNDPLLTVEGFAEATGVSINTVNEWLYHGARPSDNHLKAIAAAIGSAIGAEWEQHLLNRLRQFYLLSDIAELVQEIIGPKQLSGIVDRLRKYSEFTFVALGNLVQKEDRTKELMDIVFSGTGTTTGAAIAYGMSKQEKNPEWQLDLEAAAFDGWAKRIRTVVRRLRSTEVSSMDEGLRDWHMGVWSVSNIKAYKAYERSLELIVEGKSDDALGLVERAKDLDPTDPVYHFTLGSHWGGLGARSGDLEMVRRGLDELWLATELAPEWLLPWTTISLVLLEAGHHQEALEHLLAVDPKRDQQEPMYYFGLAFAYDGIGDYSNALDAIEKGLEYEPESRQLAIGGATFAAKLGFGQRARKYRRLARHSGASEQDLFVIDWWIKNGRDTQ